MDKIALLDRLINEIERVEYRSHDPYDLLGSGPIVFLRKRQSGALTAITSKEPTRKQKIVRMLLAPIYQNSLTMRMYRLLMTIPPVQHPKTMGLMLQAYAALRRLDRAKFCAQWLMKNSDQLGFGQFCWGLPWVWPSEVVIPRYGPQSTISTVNALGFVDLYETTGDRQYLDVARSVCEFFLQHLHLDKVTRDAWAFSYTPYDKQHIINVNFHCGALLARVWRHCGDERYLTTLLKICNFSVAEQRPDGAWHYSAKIDGFVNAVDNTHTGDNLEYLSLIRQVLGNQFPYEAAFKKGIDYYMNHFLTSDGMPHYTDVAPFPAESHPAGQMLITLVGLAGIDERARPMAEKLLGWITKHMMNERQNRMFYRVYETGRIDRSYSISWGDAWLAKGLAKLIEYEHGA